MVYTSLFFTPSETASACYHSSHCTVVFHLGVKKDEAQRSSRTLPLTDTRRASIQSVKEHDTTTVHCIECTCVLIASSGMSLWTIVPPDDDTPYPSVNSSK